MYKELGSNQRDGEKEIINGFTEVMSFLLSSELKDAEEMIQLDDLHLTP